MGTALFGVKKLGQAGDKRETKMSYKDRAEFSPAEHGLDPSFRLTNFTKLKG